MQHVEKIQSNVLTSITFYMHKKKSRKTINAYLNSQFSYWPLAWKMHCRKMN